VIRPDDGAVEYARVACPAAFETCGGAIVMLAFAMVVLGLVTFAALFGFVTLCDRV